MSTDTEQAATIETAIPARLDRLPWARFHWMVIVGLGTAWILDGLEVTMIGAVAARLTEKGSGISIDAGQIGLAAAIYVIGACAGALCFGQLCDRFGRKKLFMITLVIYIVATVVTAFSFAPWFFYLSRFVTGAGIGGEYSAINSAIDELIPARVRGRVDLVVNGSYWLGAAGGAAAALFFLSPVLPTWLGWRIAFGVGAVIGLAVLFVRRNVPESPRWLFIHGREQEAEELVDGIERAIARETGQEFSEPDDSITVRQRSTIPFREIARVAFTRYPRRAILCLALFVGQAFLYNGITFDLGTLMGKFYAVSSGTVPIFLVVYACGNFLGPLVLGRLFDTVGRKPMVSLSYLGSAALAVVLALLFAGQSLNSVTFIILIAAVFFLATSGASAAYLTASEIFPMETRALAIAFFYAVGTGVGGVVGPVLFGSLINTGDRGLVAIGFLVSAGAMALGGVAELVFGVAAEGEQLEDIAQPLSAEDTEEGEDDAGAGADDSAAGRERAQAEQERARAAEHRASAHEHLARAAGGDESATRLAEIDNQLAELAELLALGHDERAAAQDERAHADATEDLHQELAARERAQAAQERARIYDQRAAAMQADNDAERARYEQLADAAAERARSREQRARAAQLREHAGDDEQGEFQRARAELHEIWAQMYAHRGEAHVRSARGDAGGAEQARTAARVAAEQADAARERVEAMEHRAGAAAEQRRDAGVRATQQQAREQQRRAAAEKRLRDRIERDRSGWRRYRPGPGRVSGGRGMTVSSALPPASLEREVDAIARALDEHGVTERQELARLVGARYWGPGVFREALRQAIADDRIRRPSRSSLAPVPDEDGG